MNLGLGMPKDSIRSWLVRFLLAPLIVAEKSPRADDERQRAEVLFLGFPFLVSVVVLLVGFHDLLNQVMSDDIRRLQTDDAD